MTRLEAEFERCRPWLARSTHVHMGELLQDLQAGRAQLWPGVDAAVVTQTSTEDGRGVLTLWIVGGRLKTAMAMLPAIEAEARGWGCAETRFAPARAGWERVGRAWGFSELRPGVWMREIG